MMKRKLLIFRHTPIDVDIKMYEYFAEHFWDSDVVVFAETSFKAERKVCNYQENAAGIQTVIIDKTGTEIDDDFFSKNKNEIFIFYGISIAKKILPLIKKYNILYGIVSERDPSISETAPIKRFFRETFPVYLYIRNLYLYSHLKCFIAFGQTGVDCFNRYFCIPKRKLFGFMYNDGNSPICPKMISESDTVKFVYVGRINYKGKGVDTLLDAFRNVSGKFSLDLIGGYGNDLDDAKNKVQSMSNVRLLGACDKDKLCEVLNGYDVILVPSKKDGWNLHCNLSVNAGLGIISTDQAGSEELVKYCGNGVVVPARDVSALQNAIQEVIDNPSIVNEWKSKTSDYAEKISYKTVSEYLYNILNYSFDDTQIAEKPKCPWLH